MIAEGAETAIDAAELQALGCEYAQGEFFGQPMSAQDARKALKNGATLH